MKSKMNTTLNNKLRKKMETKKELRKKKEKLILKYSDGKNLLFYFSVFIVVFLQQLQYPDVIF